MNSQDLSVITPHSIYLTAQEAADYLRTTRGMIYNLVWRGVLPRRKGKLLFTREELDNYVNGRNAGLKSIPRKSR